MLKRILATTLALALSPALLADNILIVMSDKDALDLKDGKVYKTGFYLNELMEPVKRFLDDGHTLTFATPSGIAPALDGVSNNVQFFNNDQKYYEESVNLLETLKLTDTVNSPVISFSRVEQIGVDHFDAFFAPGGHAPMEDLLINDQLGRILTAFHHQEKPTALVCHGPIALLSTLSNNDTFVSNLKDGKKATANEDWIYKDYNMTVFSNAEEEAAKGYLAGGEMKFYPENALGLAGGNYSKAESLWHPQVVVDRELITGQNPASALAVANELLKKL